MTPKRLLTLAAALAFALPAVAGAAALNVSGESLPPFGVTAAIRDHGSAVDLAASTRGPANVLLSCDVKARLEVTMLGVEGAAPTKLWCSSKDKVAAFLFFPGLTGLRVSLVSVSGNQKPVPLHVTLRQLGAGGDVAYDAATLKLPKSR